MVLLTNIPSILSNDCTTIKAVYDSSRQPGFRLDENQALIVGLAIGRIFLTASALLVLGKKGVKPSTVGYAVLMYELFGLSYNQTSRMSTSSSLASLFSSAAFQGKSLTSWGLNTVKEAVGLEGANPIHPIAQGTLFPSVWSTLANVFKIPVVWA